MFTCLFGLVIVVYLFVLPFPTYKLSVSLVNRVENIVAKGETAKNEQFLLFLQCFEKSSAAEASESVYVGILTNL